MHAEDVRANAFAHAEAIRSARARLVVLPELSLTGYEFDADAVSAGDEALHPIAEVCAETGTLALVGAPVRGDDGRVHIAMLRVSDGDIGVAYCKSRLGGDEWTRFAPGCGPALLPLDRWRIGLGLCKDTGVDEHVRGVAARRVDVYVAGLVHRPEELEIQEERGIGVARRCEAYVAFASFAGATGGGYDRTAGVSTVSAPDSTVLARAGAEPGAIARASLT